MVAIASLYLDNIAETSISTKLIRSVFFGMVKVFKYSIVQNVLQSLRPLPLWKTVTNSVADSVVTGLPGIKKFHSLTCYSKGLSFVRTLSSDVENKLIVSKLNSPLSASFYSRLLKCSILHRLPLQGITCTRMPKKSKSVSTSKTKKGRDSELDRKYLRNVSKRGKTRGTTSKVSSLTYKKNKVQGKSSRRERAYSRQSHSLSSTKLGRRKVSSNKCTGKRLNKTNVPSLTQKKVQLLVNSGMVSSKRMQTENYESTKVSPRLRSREQRTSSESEKTPRKILRKSLPDTHVDVHGTLSCASVLKRSVALDQNKCHGKGRTMFQAVGMKKFQRSFSQETLLPVTRTQRCTRRSAEAAADGALTGKSIRNLVPETHTYSDGLKACGSPSKSRMQNADLLDTVMVKSTEVIQRRTNNAQESTSSTGKDIKMEEKTVSDKSPSKLYSTRRRQQRSPRTCTMQDTSAISNNQRDALTAAVSDTLSSPKSRSNVQFEHSSVCPTTLGVKDESFKTVEVQNYKSGFGKDNSENSKVVKTVFSWSNEDRVRSLKDIGNEGPETRGRKHNRMKSREGGSESIQDVASADGSDEVCEPVSSITQRRKSGSEKRKVMNSESAAKTNKNVEVELVVDLSDDAIELEIQNGGKKTARMEEFPGRNFQYPAAAAMSDGKDSLSHLRKRKQVSNRKDNSRTFVTYKIPVDYSGMEECEITGESLPKSKTLSSKKSTSGMMEKNSSKTEDEDLVVVFEDIKTQYEDCEVVEVVKRPQEAEEVMILDNYHRSSKVSRRGKRKTTVLENLKKSFSNMLQKGQNYLSTSCKDFVGRNLFGDSGENDSSHKEVIETEGSSSGSKRRGNIEDTSSPEELDKIILPVASASSRQNESWRYFAESGLGVLDEQDAQKMALEAATFFSTADFMAVSVEDLLTHLQELRQWEYTKLGKRLDEGEKTLSQNDMLFTFMSYNVLAQDLLEEHPELYQGVDPALLTWEQRWQGLLREIKQNDTDILCLQEVQDNHYTAYYEPSLQEMGYAALYKKKTGGKVDGCAIFYKKDKFILEEWTDVEYFQPGIPVLDRDNIGMVAKLAPAEYSGSMSTRLCVATTHLLYNPRRHDIKLAQLQMLFSEIDRIAFRWLNDENEPVYHPVLLAGDMNLPPNCAVYKFITNGKLKYKGLNNKTLTPWGMGRYLDQELIPNEIGLTDQCQHVGLVQKRAAQKLNPEYENDADISSNRTSDEKFIKIYNSWKLNSQNEQCNENSSVSVEQLNNSSGLKNGTQETRTVSASVCDIMQKSGDSAAGQQQIGSFADAVAQQQAAIEQQMSAAGQQQIGSFADAVAQQQAAIEQQMKHLAQQLQNTQNVATVTPVSHMQYQTFEQFLTQIQSSNLNPVLPIMPGVMPMPTMAAVGVEGLQQNTEDATAAVTPPLYSFNSGTLTHKLCFRSVYMHKLKRIPGETEVTTNQGGWLTVDYIFYSTPWSEKFQKKVEGRLKLVGKIGLLSGPECQKLGALPNLVCPSDHLYLLAKFLLKIS